MWQNYFKLIKLKPGRVNTALFGLIDFRNPNIPLATIQALYESDFPYLQLTPLGESEIYGVTPLAPRSLSEAEVPPEPRSLSEAEVNSEPRSLSEVEVPPVSPVPTKPRKTPRPKKS
jgi:hypothetical protein